MRPKPIRDDVRTEIEILVHVNEQEVCILDAKNYKEKFTLSAQLASHMASEYIPNYNGYKGKSVAYFGYITSNDLGGLNEKLFKNSTLGEIFQISLLVSVCEEALFRGLLQTKFGLV